MLIVTHQVHDGKQSNEIRERCAWVLSDGDLYTESSFPFPTLLHTLIANWYK